MALHNLAAQNKSLIFYRNEDLDRPRVRLVRKLMRCGRWSLTSMSLTPRLATDAGITPTSRLALFWDDQLSLLVLKVLDPLKNSRRHTRGPRYALADVVQVMDLGEVPPAMEALYFPDSPLGSKLGYQHACRPQVVSTPDGNEIHIHPPPPPGTEPDPEEDEVEFGVE